MEARRRQERDLELTYKRRSSIDRIQESRRPKADRIAALDSNALFTAERDPQRLTYLTKAAQSHQLTPSDIEVAEYQRQVSGAHSKKVALSGRDLQFSRRATPAWLKPAVR